MLYNCQVLVVAPGGLGTLDELFEVLTLRQTGKVQRDLPVLLFGVEFWNTIVNWKVRRPGSYPLPSPPSFSLILTFYVLTYLRR